MIVRIYLTLVGLTYLYLAAWCTWDPQTTSDKVGFEIKNASGASEFMTVYGGLELGLGLIFLLPWLAPQQTRYALWACIVIHGALVLFRSISLLQHSGVARTTINLAIGEWVIFLAGLAVWAWSRET